MQKMGVLGEWEGEVYVPKSIDVYSVAEMRQKWGTNVRFDYSITAGATATHSTSLTKETYWSRRPTDEIVIVTPPPPPPPPPVTECATSGEQSINNEVAVAEFLNDAAWFRVDRMPSSFKDHNEFLQWLSRKPRLVIGAESELIFDTSAIIASCEVILEKGALVTSREHDIRLLTLNMTNRGGVIRTTPVSPPAHGRAPSGGNARHYDRRYRECDCCDPTVHGLEGDRGQRGADGLPGTPAPGFILMSASVNGRLHVELIGGRGGKGGDGGNGGNGGHGRGASEGESDFLDISCECGGHDGGRGGRGGDGGVGGNGGDGGWGAKFAS